MKVTAIPAASLEPTHISRWAEIQAADPTLRSPFLSPEFTLAMAEERPAVTIGVVEDESGPIAFFPHERGRLGIARPVGGPLNDLQGVIAAQGRQLAAEDLIRNCRLVQWSFTRIIASQEIFQRYHVRRDVSRFIDLSDGFDRYAREKHRSFAARLVRKGRQLEREAGRVRFDMHAADPSLLAMMMAWKRERYAATGYCDVFQIPWARRAIQRIHDTETDRFAGRLSILWAGDEPVAAHLGVRCLDHLHSWIVSYAPRFARYSPGLLLYWNLAEAASRIGIRRIEIGGGLYPYKDMLANTEIGVASGSVDRMAMVTAARRWCETGAEWIRSSSILRPPARGALRTYRRLRSVAN